MATENSNQSGVSAAADGAKEEAAPLENTGPDPAAQKPDAAVDSGEQARSGEPAQTSDHTDTATASSPALAPAGETEPAPVAGTAPESGADAEASGGQDFSAMLENYEKESAASKQEGEIVRGLVVGITEQFVLVDIGYKSEGVVAREEFIDRNGNLAVSRGDQVDVLIKSLE